MKLQDDENCVSLMNIVYLLLCCSYDLKSCMEQSFSVIFLIVQDKNNYFFGSISMLNIIFLG